MYGVESSSLRLLLPNAKHSITHMLTVYIDLDITSSHTANILYTVSMERRSTSPSGIGMALQQQRDTLGVGSSVDAEGVRPLSVRDNHGYPMSDERMSAWLGLRVDGEFVWTIFHRLSNH